MYHSTQSNDYLWYLILREKKDKKTRIAGYCTSSTMFRPVLKNYNKIIFPISVVFFRRGVIKESDRKSRAYAFLSVIKNYANWKKNF